MWWFIDGSNPATRPKLITTRSCCIEWCCVWECRRTGRGPARSGRDPIWHIWVENGRWRSRHVDDPTAKRFPRSNPTARGAQLPKDLRPAIWEVKEKVLVLITSISLRAENAKSTGDSQNSYSPRPAAAKLLHNLRRLCRNHCPARPASQSSRCLRSSPARGRRRPSGAPTCLNSPVLRPSKGTRRTSCACGSLSPSIFYDKSRGRFPKVWRLSWHEPEMNWVKIIIWRVDEKASQVDGHFHWF